MSLDYILIGNRIRDARLAKNLTQEKLAEKLDVSIAYLSRLERGDTLINLKRLHQICSILDTSEGFILNDTYEDSKNYLNKEFSDLFKSCPAEKIKLIYNIAKVIAEN
jgi:transcriptional regulator with XRE-family HTH domain